MNKQTRVILYVLFDFLTAALSWAAFYIYRKIQVEPDVFGYKIPLELGTRFYLGIIIIPIFWLTLYYLSGAYQDVLRKSKLRELGQTLIIVLTGAVILFFALILDDVIVSYKDYYSSFFILASIQFILTYIPRLILTSNTAKQIQRDRIRFNTLMISATAEHWKFIRSSRKRTIKPGIA